MVPGSLRRVVVLLEGAAWPCGALSLGHGPPAMKSVDGHINAVPPTAMPGSSKGTHGSPRCPGVVSRIRPGAMGVAGGSWVRCKCAYTTLDTCGGVHSWNVTQVSVITLPIMKSSSFGAPATVWNAPCLYGSRSNGEGGPAGGSRWVKALTAGKAERTPAGKSRASSAAYVS